MTRGEDLEELAHPHYWDERYAGSASEKPTHEWFLSYQSLLPFLESKLFQCRGPETKPRILHLGSGDSTIPRDLAKQGYDDQLCVDFSKVVVDHMVRRDADLPGIEWSCGDVCHMDGIPSNSIDVAFDKGTLDAMIHGSPWSPPQEVLDRTAEYMREVFRTLKEDGVFLCISFRPQHFITPRLNCDGVNWDSEIVVLGGEASLPYHGYVLKKKQSVPQ